jgi:iron complex transport system ATP-binding protein
MMPDLMLEARDLAATYGHVEVFREISLQLRRGTLTALIGPNGSGKTTLLHTLCGIRPAAGGRVLIEGRPLSRFGRREIAQRVCLVPQFAEVGFEVTVEEAVALGRYPWQGPLAASSAADRAACEAALKRMDLLSLRRRTLSTLSGGERQRAYLARALAQETPVLLLDEPVANLDLRYQQETYERLRDLVDTQQKAALVADHHLNLIAATCDRVAVLSGGRLSAYGTPQEIVSEEMIKDVFGARMRVSTGEEGVPQCQWDF